MWHIYGLGSPHGDDRLGWEIVDRLSLTWPAQVRAIAAPMTLLDYWSSAQQVVVVDACQLGGRPGEVHRWAIDQFLARPWASRPSTHGGSLADVLRLAHTLGVLPAQLQIFGVEVQREACRPGTGLSDVARVALDDLARSLQDLLAERGPDT